MLVRKIIMFIWIFDRTYDYYIKKKKNQQIYIKTNCFVNYIKN